MNMGGVTVNNAILGGRFGLIAISIPPMTDCGLSKSAKLRRVLHPGPNGARTGAGSVSLAWYWAPMESAAS